MAQTSRTYRGFDPFPLRGCKLTVAGCVPVDRSVHGGSRRLPKTRVIEITQQVLCQVDHKAWNKLEWK